MPIDVTALTPGFCAEIGGVDITKPIAPEVLREIRDAFDTYSVLVFHDQPMDDDTQVAFSRYFGSAEIGGGAHHREVESATGAELPAEIERAARQLAVGIFRECRNRRRRKSGRRNTVFASVQPGHQNRRDHPDR